MRIAPAIWQIMLRRTSYRRTSDMVWFDDTDGRFMAINHRRCAVCGRLTRWRFGLIDSAAVAQRALPWRRGYALAACCTRACARTLLC